VTSLLLALAWSVSAGGCQVLAGLTVLEITTGTTTSSTGGQGGAGGSSYVPCANSRTKTLEPTKGPARLECNGQCNGLKVFCQGPFPCEIVCDDNSCDGLILRCGPDGQCKLTCTGSGCTGVTGATVICGDNGCQATCTNPAAKVAQDCKGSCDCSKGTCQ